MDVKKMCDNKKVLTIFTKKKVNKSLISQKFNLCKDLKTTFFTKKAF